MALTIFFIPVQNSYISEICWREAGHWVCRNGTANFGWAGLTNQSRLPLEVIPNVPVGQTETDLSIWSFDWNYKTFLHNVPNIPILLFRRYHLWYVGGQGKEKKMVKAIPLGWSFLIKKSSFIYFWLILLVLATIMDKSSWDTLQKRPVWFNKWVFSV